MPLANLWWLTVQIPGLFVLFFAMSWVYRAIPERISVFEDCVLIQHGETAVRIEKSSITAARIVVFADDAIRLRIWYTYKDHKKCNAFGLPRNFDLAALENSLEVTLTVFDGRASTTHNEIQGNQEMHRSSGGNSTLHKYSSAGTR